MSNIGINLTQLAPSSLSRVLLNYTADAVRVVWWPDKRGWANWPRIPGGLEGIEWEISLFLPQFPPILSKSLYHQFNSHGAARWLRPLQQVRALWRVQSDCSVDGVDVQLCPGLRPRLVVGLGRERPIWRVPAERVAGLRRQWHHGTCRCARRRRWCWHWMHHVAWKPHWPTLRGWRTDPVPTAAYSPIYRWPKSTRPVSPARSPLFGPGPSPAR
jgi:hypothetical protein